METAQKSLPAFRRGAAWKAVVVAGLLATGAPANAGILKFFGWDVSKEKVWQQVEYYVQIIADVETKLGIVGTISPPAGAIIKAFPVLMRIIDPPAARLVSGRVTIQLSPTETFSTAGWYGEFGANPLLGTPTVPTGGLIDHSLLQAGCNPAMVSCSTTYDAVTHRVVMEFDWGPAGFEPTLNLSAQGHFNFAAVYSFSDTAAVPFGRVGSLGDVIANGTNASTYLMCTSGRCGAVPEPSSWAMLIAGFGAIGLMARRQRFRRRSNPPA